LGQEREQDRVRSEAQKTSDSDKKALEKAAEDKEGASTNLFNTRMRILSARLGDAKGLATSPDPRARQLGSQAEQGILAELGQPADSKHYQLPQQAPNWEDALVQGMNFHGEALAKRQEELDAEHKGDIDSKHKETDLRLKILQQQADQKGEQADQKGNATTEKEWNDFQKGLTHWGLHPAMAEQKLQEFESKGIDSGQTGAVRDSLPHNTILSAIQTGAANPKLDAPGKLRMLQETQQALRQNLDSPMSMINQEIEAAKTAGESPTSAYTKVVAAHTLKGSQGSYLADKLQPMIDAANAQLAPQIRTAPIATSSDPSLVPPSLQANPDAARKQMLESVNAVLMDPAQTPYGRGALPYLPAADRNQLMGQNVGWGGMPMVPPNMQPPQPQPDPREMSLMGLFQ
jgi:hypothetical protein